MFILPLQTIEKASRYAKIKAKNLQKAKNFFFPQNVGSPLDHPPNDHLRQSPLLQLRQLARLFKLSVYKQSVLVIEFVINS
jgi:hypothetical protein